MRLNECADAVKSMVSVRDAVDAYLPGTKRVHSRIPCPVHNGRDCNCEIRPTWFKCYVCGAGGDVISFTENIFGLGFTDAVKKLNDDFSLNLPIGSSRTMREVEDFRAKWEIARKKRLEEEREAEWRKGMYYAALDCWEHCRRVAKELEPKNPDEEPSEDFAIAVKMIPYWAYMMDVYA